MNRLLLILLASGGFLLLFLWAGAPAKTAAHDKDAHPLAGTWRLNQPGIGESNLKITDKGDGVFDVMEDGLGNVGGPGTFKDGLLTVYWAAGPDYRGMWILCVDETLKIGKGKVCFIDCGADHKGIRELEAGGTKFREIVGVTIRRIDK